MKSNNNKLKSIITLVVVIAIIIGTSVLAFVACKGIGQGQSTSISNSANQTDDNNVDSSDSTTTTAATTIEGGDSNGGGTGVAENKEGFFDKNKIKLGLDLKGGVNIVYEPDLTEGISGEELQQAMQGAQKLIQQRLDARGYTEAEVSIEGTKRLRVDIPGVEDPQKAINEIGAAGMLHFYDGPKLSEGMKIEGLENADIPEPKEILNGTHIKSATPSQNTQTGEYYVSIQLNDEGTKIFDEYTGAHQGEQIYIYLDDQLLSFPTLSAHITDGSGSISGNFTLESVKDLADGINAGSLPFTLQAISAQGVGAKLGMTALNTSMLAGIIGFILILIYMICMYRLCGVAADIALCLYVGLVVLILTIMNATLTLPGIAGILLSIGMAVDANVIIFARIKEELDTGKSVRFAVDSGFNKALWAIVDGNVTTLVAAVVLYFFGTGLIKSFATTLIVGIVVSLFTALVITSLILKAFVGLGIKDAKLFAKVKKPNAPDKMPFNFIGNRVKFYIGSIIVIALGIIFMIVNASTGKGAFNQDIEFSGGSLIQVNMGQAITTDMRDDITNITKDTTGVSNVRITTAGDTSVIVTTPTLDADARTKLFEAIKGKYNLGEDALESDESFSASISGDIKKGAIEAVVVGVIIILLYITWRFRNFKMGTSAVIALCHDVLVMFAAYAIFRVPLNNSFIAAMLTIVGYSINDTIVVFDRIRENRTKAGSTNGKPTEAIINKSLSQTMGRSISTSLTTVVIVLLLFILGPASVKEFAFPLIIGILAGTYSSLCVASPIWFDMSKNQKDSKPASKNNSSKKSSKNKSNKQK